MAIEPNAELELQVWVCIWADAPAPAVRFERLWRLRLCLGPAPIPVCASSTPPGLSTIGRPAGLLRGPGRPGRLAPVHFDTRRGSEHQLWLPPQPTAQTARLDERDRGRGVDRAARGARGARAARARGCAACYRRRGKSSGRPTAYTRPSASKARRHLSRLRPSPHLAAAHAAAHEPELPLPRAVVPARAVDRGRRALSPVWRDRLARGHTAQATLAFAFPLAHDVIRLCPSGRRKVGQCARRAGAPAHAHAAGDAGDHGQSSEQVEECPGAPARPPPSDRPAPCPFRPWHCDRGERDPHARVERRYLGLGVVRGRKRRHGPAHRSEPHDAVRHARRGGRDVRAAQRGAGVQPPAREGAEGGDERRRRVGAGEVAGPQRGYHGGSVSAPGGPATSQIAPAPTYSQQVADALLARPTRRVARIALPPRGETPRVRPGPRGGKPARGAGQRRQPLWRVHDGQHTEAGRELLRLGRDIHVEASLRLWRRRWRRRRRVCRARGLQVDRTESVLCPVREHVHLFRRRWQLLWPLPRLDLQQKYIGHQPCVRQRGLVHGGALALGQSGQVRLSWPGGMGHLTSAPRHCIYCLVAIPTCLMHGYCVYCAKIVSQRCIKRPRSLF